MVIDYDKRKANYILTTEDTSPEAREFMASNPEYAFEYANYILKGRFVEGEKVITTDPRYAYYYAIHVLKGRFSEAEKAIATNSRYSYLYARYVLKRRFQAGEEAIAAVPYYAERYKEFLNSDILQESSSVSKVNVSPPSAEPWEKIEKDLKIMAQAAIKAGRTELVGWYMKEANKAAELPAYRALLFQSQQPFFNKVITTILQIAPETVEIWLHGSRAVAQYKKQVIGIFVHLYLI